MTQALDVINGTVKDMREHPTLNEIADADDMIQGLEDNSLTLYDRLYPTRKIIHRHNEFSSFFLFRLRESVMTEMRVIYKSKRRRMTVDVDGITVHLIKIRNPKSGEWDYFASNMPLRLVTDTHIRKLYNLRWEVGVSSKGHLNLVGEIPTGVRTQSPVAREAA